MRQAGSAPRPRSRRRLVALALVPALLIGLGACSSEPAGPPPVKVIADKGTPYGDLLIPQLTVSVKDGAVDVPLDRPVTVSATSGVLGSVTMVNEAGNPVEGKLSPDGVTWSTSEPLGYNKSYTLTAQSLGLGGVTAEKLTFETQSPENLTMPYLLPGDGETVGVGQPIAVRFDENIPNRLAAERAIKVTTNPPVEGAFYWLNNREVRWRPQNYWKPGTTVDVAVNTYGVDLGDGLFGQENLASHFTIGDEVIATADDDTKQLTVRRNGVVERTIPISMGKNSTPTNNGVYIVGDRLSHMIMDSSTYGVPSNSPNGYRTEVDWATQMSYSGIYVHSAPWSVGAQGYSNTSHGCLNASPSNAQWFYNNTKRGDIVEVHNTVGSTLPGTDGLGDWNIPWPQWKAGNANA
ncbi:lipoprotein-anchoring transpeptidase ErfK/SrfK [Mycolicibacterium sp. BK556]|uniref:L,D-transpeptidase n=1 Tax=Mycobacteriaceae TaxID=1762 RepID=UPI001062348A|nr:MULTISPECIES: Ig-like domain-containing protein [Mycobacteriaceae]MBB3603015.1 lipoprotein-anchoring transpeptidase ErfK/SrfK [Mycolicibacterium sp. BK556]MBB3633210.1 lipoprotein-anchoring transpeptidase ErfK/SrfK [Mycolicibacterium sp. BK607]MBB3750760.1 lipoprotein-anchoring transpeptidase ErfK/SrfK [Mycolicibacterium sp. BK634]TDO07184.1 lipoprotein-anchoring transpeptidase ErfK/SrfK [Mycobacterium sp. BK086]